MNSKGALLTKKQRQFLTGELTYDGDYAKQQRYQRRQAIRERVFSGLLDGTLLWYELPDEQRRTIFELWKEVEDGGGDGLDDAGLSGEHYDVEASLAKWRGKIIFEDGLKHLLAFLYLGVEESDEFDFEELLTSAIEEAEWRRGYFADVSYSLERTEKVVTEELLERFEERDASLGHAEIQYLRDEEAIDDEDLIAYYDGIGE